MPLKDMLAALVVIVAWGANFVAIKVGVQEIPPLLLGALRFVFVAFPAILFIRRPAVSWRMLMAYGLTFSLGQFIFLFVAIHLGMPAGLASLVLQSQAFFTVLIAAIVLRERIARHHVLGMSIAVVGLVLVDTGAQAGAVPLVGFLLTLCAAMSWAAGNIVLKGVGKIDMLPLVVWGAVMPPVPFFLLSLIFEGPQLIVDSLINIRWQGVLALVYLVLVASLIGYVLWGRLLARHPVSRVAPLSLLIPVVGLLCANWFLDESLGLWQWVGGAIVVMGLGVNLFGVKLLRRVP